jgi:hypothetical protein
MQLTIARRRRFRVSSFAVPHAVTACASMGQNRRFLAISPEKAKSL